jgi:rRNA-processing protein FCF1
MSSPIYHELRILINITDKRHKESERIRDKYPDRIPVRHVQQVIYAYFLQACSLDYLSCDR